MDRMRLTLHVRCRRQVILVRARFVQYSFRIAQRLPPDRRLGEGWVRGKGVVCSTACQSTSQGELHWNQHPDGHRLAATVSGLEAPTRHGLHRGLIQILMA